MIKKIIAFVMLGSLWVSAATEKEHEEILDIRESRMKSLEVAVEKTKECFAVMGCVALDLSIIQGFDTEGAKASRIAMTTARILFPDLIEGVAGKRYRDQFTQALLVAGLCLAPEFTIGSYAAVWLAKKAGERFSITSVKQRATNYWASRLGGYCFAAAVSRN
jgi:hypothetical protein